VTSCPRYRRAIAATAGPYSACRIETHRLVACLVTVSNLRRCINYG